MSKHLYIGERLEIVNDENEFATLIGENMGYDSEKYFNEIIEECKDQNEQEYYEALAESREMSCQEAVRELEEIVDYYFTNNGRINKKFLEREIKVVLDILYNRE